MIAETYKQKREQKFLVCCRLIHGDTDLKLISIAIQSSVASLDAGCRDKLCELVGVMFALATDIMTHR